MKSVRQIFVIDDLHPEDNSMLQALYSRSPNSVVKHLDKVKGSDSGTFMEKFYIGYGHKSIADCGTTTLFVENVSMLAAKAIQDWPLYSGQEASTRYLDYSVQEVLNPLESAEGKLIQDEWMKFYVEGKSSVVEHLKMLYPIKEGEDSKVYDRAINAKSFDIMRGFLPAGATTYLSWHTNLRQAYEKIQLLLHHPLTEIREIAEDLKNKLSEKYSHSFIYKQYPEQEAFFEKCAQKYTYFFDEKHSDFEMNTNVSAKDLEMYSDILLSRPIKTNLPSFMGKLGQFNFKFLLDFGSFRDVQRHRNGENLMPLLTTKLGFYPWYISMLPESFKEKAKAFLAEQEAKISALPCDDFVRQYYIAMGYTVGVDITYRLPAAIYVSELRSDTTVHPTLRVRAQQMGRSIVEKFPLIKMHINEMETEWDIRRGKQDIVEK
ncbi:MAG: FAD-dependent thymidylate synthase [Candidatus Gracilibacteria bacterium]|jgi:thymidylate synthase ThyX|nr:FAD-dependent thymidylate synthase [Candidatus Gracilibacteria bacterium]